MKLKASKNEKQTFHKKKYILKYSSILLLVVALAILLYISIFHQNDTRVYDERFFTVRELIVKQVSEKKVPSIVVAVAKNGKIIWEEAFGWSDLENQVKATPHTLYRLGSIAKNFTATALMTLVEQGEIDLEKPISTYLPENIELRIYEGNAQDITVRRLLNHRSGIPSFDETYFEDIEKPRPFSETVHSYGIVAFKPGGSYIYSNLNYQILGLIVSEVSGMSYQDYIESRVFDPLGLSEAKVYGGRQLNKSYAIGYTQSLKRIPPWAPAQIGSSSIYASVHDLIRYAMFHLGTKLPDQEPILTDNTIRSMHAENPPSNKRYGIGWAFSISNGGYSSVDHGGEAPGVDCILRLVPTEKIAIAVLCNAECEKLYEIQNSIIEVLIPDINKTNIKNEKDTASKTPEPPEEIFGTWSGTILTYEGKIRVKITIDADGALIKLDDQPEHELNAFLFTPNFILGMFDGLIPTSDNESRPYKNRIAVVREGDRLYGSVTCVSNWEERSAQWERSYRIELHRLLHLKTQ